MANKYAWWSVLQIEIYLHFFFGMIMPQLSGNSLSSMKNHTYRAICHFMAENNAQLMKLNQFLFNLFLELMEWQLPISMAVFYGRCGFFNHIQLRDNDVHSKTDKDFFVCGAVPAVVREESNIVQYWRNSLPSTTCVQSAMLMTIPITTKSERILTPPSTVNTRQYSKSSHVLSLLPPKLRNPMFHSYRFRRCVNWGAWHRSDSFAFTPLSNE